LASAPPGVPTTSCSWLDPPSPASAVRMPPPASICFPSAGTPVNSSALSSTWNSITSVSSRLFSAATVPSASFATAFRHSGRKARGLVRTRQNSDLHRNSCARKRRLWGDCSQENGAAPYGDAGFGNFYNTYTWTMAKSQKNALRWHHGLELYARQGHAPSVLQGHHRPLSRNPAPRRRLRGATLWSYQALPNRLRSSTAMGSTITAGMARAP